MTNVDTVDWKRVFEPVVKLNANSIIEVDDIVDDDDPINTRTCIIDVSLFDI